MINNLEKEETYMDKQEFINKVSSAKTADEIFAIAKENGVEIPADKAEESKVRRRIARNGKRGRL